MKNNILWMGSITSLALLLSGCENVTVQGVLGLNRGVQVNTGSNQVQLPAGQYPVTAKLQRGTLQITANNGFTFKVKNLQKGKDAKGRETFSAAAGSNGQNFSVSGVMDTKAESSSGRVTSESCVLSSRRVRVCNGIRDYYSFLNAPENTGSAFSKFALLASAQAGRGNDGNRGGSDNDNDRGGRGSSDNDRSSGGRGNNGNNDNDSGSRGGRGSNDNDRRDNDRSSGGRGSNDNDRRDNDRRDNDRRDNDRRDNDRRDNDRRDNDRRDSNNGRGNNGNDRRDNDNRDNDNDRRDQERRDQARRDQERRDQDRRDDERRRDTCYYEDESVYGSRTVRESTTNTYARVQASIILGNAKAGDFSSQWTVKDTSRSSTPLSACH